MRCANLRCLDDVPHQHTCPQVAAYQAEKAFIFHLPGHTGAMGALAYYFSNRAIFFLTAALAIPTLIALAQIRPSEIDPDSARGGVRKSDPGSWFDAIASLARSRALLLFAASIVLFQLANAAMLPIMAGLLTMRAPEWASGKGARVGERLRLQRGDLGAGGHAAAEAILVQSFPSLASE